MAESAIKNYGELIINYAKQNYKKMFREPDKVHRGRFETTEKVKQNVENR